MKNLMIDAKFYETYYFCNIINNILHDQSTFLHKLDAFYGNGNIIHFLQPFQKYSIFHQFLEFVVTELYFENIEEIDLEKIKIDKKNFSNLSIHIDSILKPKLPIELAFEYYNIEYPTFTDFLDQVDKTFETSDEEDLYDYMREIQFDEAYDSLITQTVQEIFHVLFQNRKLMLIFNEMMANAFERQSSEILPEEMASISKTGKLARTTMPKWVKDAVYFRDRARCILCDKDLSGTTNLDNTPNYDHIVPLAKYGFNDVTNIQLLCKECNQKEKKDKFSTTSNIYQSWYSY